MSKGIVKWFSLGKGFGFIEREDGADLFVHINDVKGQDLQEGDEVMFEIGEGRKGPCATEVSICAS